MKTKMSLLILVFFASTRLLLGQNFVNIDNQWNVKSEVNFGGYWTEVYKLSGDSVVNSKTYKKIQISFDTAINDWSFFGLVREDSSKVYFIKQNLTSEGLLYDFGLMAGETTYVINQWNSIPEQITCQSVDSVLCIGGYRTRWTFSTNEEWINGIGSLKGPFYVNASVFDLYFHLLCFHQNGMLDFMSPLASSCYETNVGINELNNKSKISVFPNPVLTGLPVNINTTIKIEKIEILNTAGIKLKEYPMIFENDVTLRLDELESGIYIIRIKACDSGIYTNKIIKI